MRRFAFPDGYVHELTPGEWHSYAEAIRTGIFLCKESGGIDADNAYRSYCGAARRVYAAVRRNRRRASLYVDLGTAGLVLPRPEQFELIAWAEAHGISDHDIGGHVLRLSEVPNEAALGLMRKLLAAVRERAVPFYEGEPILSRREGAYA